MSGAPENKPSETPTPATPAASLITETKPTETPPIDTTKPGEAPKADETPKPAETVVEPAAPLTMESIKLPEGFEVDPETSTKFLDILNDDKMTPAERAQALVDLQSGMIAKVVASAQEAFATQQTEWIDEVKKDSEIGGEKLAPTLGQIAKLVVQYGSPELKQVFDTTGAGNNIHVIKFLSKIAGDLGEGGPVSGSPPVTQASLAERMYPSMKKQGA